MEKDWTSSCNLSHLVSVLWFFLGVSTSSIRFTSAAMQLAFVVHYWAVIGCHCTAKWCRVVIGCCCTMLSCDWLSVLSCDWLLFYDVELWLAVYRWRDKDATCNIVEVWVAGGATAPWPWQQRGTTARHRRVWSGLRQREVVNCSSKCSNWK